MSSRSVSDIQTRAERNSLIIHEENTKEIMSVKEFVYLIQNSADLHKCLIFSPNIIRLF
jgi:hypothetical protein